MPRKLEIKRTPSGQRSLFAVLPDEVVNHLNEFCLKRQIGRRDDLLEHLLRHFLGTPRKPPKRVPAAVDRAVRRGSPSIERARTEVDALDSARRHAEAIVELTSAKRKKRTA